jgi:hypothetical protein
MKGAISVLRKGTVQVRLGLLIRYVQIIRILNALSFNP